MRTAPTRLPSTVIALSRLPTVVRGIMRALSASQYTANTAGSGAEPPAYNCRMAIAPVAELVAELAAGRMVILVDEEDRENEGDLLMAAEHASPESINFMARFGRGLICLTLTRERCELLQLPPMAARNGAQHGTACTVRERSAAEMPVVTPSAASIDTVKAVPFLSPLRVVMGGSRRCSQRSRVSVRQIRPRPKRAMKLKIGRAHV